MASPVLQSTRPQNDATPPRMSPGFGVGTGAGKTAGLPSDPMAYRRQFRDRWTDFLRAHFHNHLHVAVFFGVDEKTARLWWNYVNEPKGWAVSFARDNIPGAADFLRLAA